MRPGLYRSHVPQTGAGDSCQKSGHFFTGEDGTRSLFLRDRREDELVVMEGVMGIYDGLGGIREEGSSYHLAKVTQTPIILVVDAKGMGKSVIPLITGFLAYDKEHLIRGVIFNRMSAVYYEILKPLAEEELGIAVLGYFPEIRTYRSPADILACACRENWKICRERSGSRRQN